MGDSTEYLVKNIVAGREKKLQKSSPSISGRLHCSGPFVPPGFNQQLDGQPLAHLVQRIKTREMEYRDAGQLLSFKAIS